MTSDDDESSNSDKESNSDDDFVVTQYSSSESSWSDFEDNSEGITSCQFYRLFNSSIESNCWDIVFLISWLLFVVVFQL